MKQISYAPLILLHNADNGGCGIYRIHSVAQALHQHGYANCRVTNKLLTQEGFKGLNPEIVVVQRQYYDHQIEVLRQYKKAGAHIVYDLDDAVHKTPSWSPHAHVTPKDFLKRLKRLSSSVDTFSVSTQALADELRPHVKGTPIKVRPNYLPDSWCLINRGEPTKDRKFRIGFAGGIAHEGDLRLLFPAMRELGDSVEWHFIFDNPGFQFPSEANVKLIKPTPYNQYGQNLANLDVDLMVAPLEASTFNRCKSDLRLKEYGACGFPVLASDFGPYKDFPHVFKAKDEEDFLNQIRHYMVHRKEAKNEGKKLQAHVRYHYIISDHLDEIMEVLGAKPHRIDPVERSHVTVIVPCYKGVETTKRCLESVVASLPHNVAKTKLLIVNDASPEPAMHEMLRQFVKDNECPTYEGYVQVSLHENNKNLGYTKSVNNAIQLTPGPVITLNSDTEVFGDWIDRLHKVAKSNKRIASVTPLGSNASICTFRSATQATHEQVDKAASKTNEIMYTPTPVGFCMYLSRSVLAKCGLFDEHGYNRGYGEENDWASWTLDHGYHHVLTSSVYVHHAGSVSFGEEAQKLQQVAEQRMALRYPRYRQMIVSILTQDPMRRLREAVELELLKGGKSILYTSHTFGGGMETHVKEVSRDYEKEGYKSYILRNEGARQAVLCSRDSKYDNIRPFDLTLYSDLQRFKETLAILGVESVQIHTTYGYDNTFPNFLMEALEGIPYDVMLHDYISICPQIFLLHRDADPDRDMRYCGLPAPEECNKCIGRGSAFGFVDIENHRNTYKKLLEGARTLWAPSGAAATPISDVLKLDKPIYVRQHKTHIEKPKAPTGKNIALIGSIGPHKGSRLLSEVIPKTSTTFILIGSAGEEVPRSRKLVDTGTYKSMDEVIERAHKTNCKLALLLSTYPETHMYTLTEAYAAGLWPVCFDLGTQAARIKASGVGTLLPIEWMYGDHSDEIADVLHSLLNKDLGTVDPEKINVSYDSPTEYYNGIEND